MYKSKFAHNFLSKGTLMLYAQRCVSESLNCYILHCKKDKYFWSDIKVPLCSQPERNTKDVKQRKSKLKLTWSGVSTMGDHLSKMVKQFIKQIYIPFHFVYLGIRGNKKKYKAKRTTLENDVPKGLVYFSLNWSTWPFK